jgi:hypothetical protein
VAALFGGSALLSLWDFERTILLEWREGQNWSVDEKKEKLKTRSGWMKHWK